MNENDIHPEATNRAQAYAEKAHPQKFDTEQGILGQGSPAHVPTDAERTIARMHEEMRLQKWTIREVQAERDRIHTSKLEVERELARVRETHVKEIAELELRITRLQARIAPNQYGGFKARDTASEKPFGSR